MGAVTVAAVLLIIILVAVVIYQIVDICTLNGRKAEMLQKLEDIQTEQKNCDNWLDYYNNHEDEVMYTLILQQYGAGVIKK